jgi:hypothetical protein
MSEFSERYDALNAKSEAAMKRLAEGNEPEPYDPRYKPLRELLEKQEAILKVKPHSLCRRLADKIGIVPALILKFIAYKVYSVRHQRDGKLWYYAAYRGIAKQYPYLHPSTINRAIEALAKENLLQIGNYNRRKNDKTRWFSVSEEVRNLAETGLIYFDPKDASVMGLKAAIVFYHLNYAFRNKSDLLKDGVWLKVWPSDLVEFQPLSKLEAHNALVQLVSMGYLVKELSTPCSSYYRLGNICSDSRVLDSEADPHGNGARPIRL